MKEKIKMGSNKKVKRLAIDREQYKRAQRQEHGSQ